MAIRLRSGPRNYIASVSFQTMPQTHSIEAKNCNRNLFLVDATPIELKMK